MAQLADRPLRGSIVGPRGGRREASLSRQELLFTLLASDANPISRADYPAAAVSALDGDPAPLLQDRCPRDVPLIPPTAPLPTSLAELATVRGVPGRRGRLVRAVAVTLGDLFDDLFATFFSDPEAVFDDRAVRGGGLRGGTYVAGDELVRLTRYEFVPGVRL